METTVTVVDELGRMAGIVRWDQARRVWDGYYYGPDGAEEWTVQDPSLADAIRFVEHAAGVEDR